MPTAAEKLDILRAQKLGSCQRCNLHRTRGKIVFGSGNPEAKMMVIGEAPDQHEDQQGEPFVGAAGHILDLILADLGIKRSEIYIANVLKCRPPNNADPLPEQVTSCSPFLIGQVISIRPSVIVTLGRYAGNLMAGHKVALDMGVLRTQTWYFTHEKANLQIPVVSTWHPSYIDRAIKTLEQIHETTIRPERVESYQQAVGDFRRAQALASTLDLDALI